MYWDRQHKPQNSQNYSYFNRLTPLLQLMRSHHTALLLQQNIVICPSRPAIAPRFIDWHPSLY
jgi:hypothetical protein